MMTEARLVRQTTGENIRLGREPVTIGRKSTNVIRLADDPKISRLHAKVYLQGGDYVVEDEQSANGTFVNDQRLTQPHILQDGDTIQVGSTTFTVHLPPDEDEPTLVGAMPTNDDATFARSVVVRDNDTTFVGSVVVPDNDATFVSSPSAVRPTQPPPAQPPPLPGPVAPPSAKRSSLGKWLILLILLIILGVAAFFLLGFLGII